MRITSGQFRGTQLFTPEDDAIRPTSDMARQAIFNSILSGKYNFTLRDCTVLDGTCGTGAMGIEALSRGAKFCYFIDQDQHSIKLTQRNCDKVQLTKDRFKIIQSKLTSFTTDQNIDLVCLDPPYGQDLLPQMIAHLMDFSGITKDTLFILEEDAKTPVHLPLTILDRRRYGAAQIIYAKMPA